MVGRTFLAGPSVYVEEGTLYITYMYETTFTLIKVRKKGQGRKSGLSVIAEKLD